MLIQQMKHIMQIVRIYSLLGSAGDVLAELFY